MRRARSLSLGLSLLSIAVHSAGDDGPEAASVMRVSSGAAGVRPSREATEKAEQHLLRSESAMGRRFDPAFRLRQLDRLATRPVAFATSAGAGNGFVTQGLGDSQRDLVYTSVEPCRIFDTRTAAQGALHANEARNFLIAGNDGFAGQGGAASGCGVPLGPATSVVLNLTIVAPTGPGDLRAWAVSDPQAEAPLASVVNFGLVSGLPALANAVLVPICDRAMVGGSCPSDLRLQADVSGAHVVGDVLGYFRSVDLQAEVLVGSEGIGPFTLTGEDFVAPPVSVLTPARLVDCNVTCSISVSSTAANASGSALLESGAKLEGSVVSVRGGPDMPFGLVASAGSSAVSQTITVTLGMSLRFQFACHIAATGDFLGDTARGTVSWVCR